MSAHKLLRQQTTPKESSNVAFTRSSPLKEPSSLTKEKELHTDTLSSMLEAKAAGTILSLEDQFIGDKGAVVLSNFLAHNSQFTSIELRGNNLSPHSFSQLCHVLKKSTALTNLKLDWNLIGENSTVGIEALAELVKSLPSLQVIDLRNNQLGKGSGPFLAAIIKDCPSLQRIDLRWNDLGDTEARHILSALTAETKQIKINLGGGKIGGNKISEPLILEINKLATGKHPDISTSYTSSSSKTHARSSSLCLPSNARCDYNSNSASGDGSQSKSSILKPINSNCYVEKSPENYRSPQDPDKKQLSRAPSRNETFGSPANAAKAREDEHEEQNQASSQLIKLKKVSYTPVRKNSSKENQDLSPIEDRLMKMDEGCLSRKNSSKYPDIVSRNEVRQVYREMQQKNSNTNSPMKQFEKSQALNALSEKTSSLIDLNKSGTSEYIRAKFNDNEDESKGLRETQLLEENHLKQPSQKDAHTRVNESFRGNDSQDHKAQRYHQLEREIAEERRLRREGEQKHIELEEALKNSQSRVYELEISNKKLLQDYERIRVQNKDLRAQIESKEAEHNSILKDQEKKNEHQLKVLHDRIAHLEKDIIKIKDEHEDELRRVSDEWDAECKKIDRQVQEMNKMLEQVSLDHENEIKQMRLQIQEEEKAKAQKAMKEFEESFNNKRQRRASVAIDNNSSFYSTDGKSLRSPSPVAAKSGDMGKKLGATGSSEKEVERVLSENRKLKNQLSEALKINEQLECELSSKEKALRKVEEDAFSLLKDTTKLRESHNHQQGTGMSKTEKKKAEQTEKMLRAKIQQLEAGIAHAREESAKARLEYDKLKDLIQGNVSKIISQTFSAHQSSAKKDRSKSPKHKV